MDSNDGPLSLFIFLQGFCFVLLFTPVASLLKYVFVDCIYLFRECWRQRNNVTLPFPSLTSSVVFSPFVGLLIQS